MDETYNPYRTGRRTRGDDGDLGARAPTSYTPPDPTTPTIPIRRTDHTASLPVLSFPTTDQYSSNEYVPPRDAFHHDPFRGSDYHNQEYNYAQNAPVAGPQQSRLSPETSFSEGLDTSYRPYSADYDAINGRISPVQGGQAWNNSFYNDRNELLDYRNDPHKDLESQTEHKRMNVFGMPFHAAEEDEYADGDNYEQLPIDGDEYALNTWDERERFHYDSDDERGTLNGDDSTFGEEKAIQPKRVKLFKGNLILDCPVSEKLLSQYPEHEPAREFTHMRYSAATSDPSEFANSNFTLRQMCYSTPRETELCIAITIYNEDDVLLARTLQGVFNNIRHLCSRSRSKTWGAQAWKKVVVCIIADGREKINPRAKALMAALGVYQEGFAKNMVNEKAVEAHIFEYTTMCRIAKVASEVKLTADKATPVQMIFCLKEKNKKKINSHRWFFQAFCPILRPKVCVLLDAGTRPGNRAIYHLWKTFDNNPRVGGACGEIAAALGPGYTKLINPLVAAQNFEYKMSNILDKPSESVFGFITVLPGAFSAYRFEALQNDANGVGPLEKYFKGEKLEATGGIFSSNMYLAEDRILCWELVAKRGCDWVLRYVKSAKAHTDVPEKFSELILQRRRWLNGSFFASIYAQVHMFSIWRTSHSLAHKLAFHVEFLYQTFTLLFSWFSVGNFFLVFKLLTAALGDPSMNFAPGKVLSVVLTWIYAACLVTTFVLSFGNRPKGTRWFYDLIVVFFALLMAYIVFAAIFIAVKSIEYTICKNSGFQVKMLVTDKTFRDLLISLLATYALYFLASILFLEPWHMITSFVQYILLSPAYINVLNVYAFCNTHDISWGTKGDTKVKTDLGIVKADDAGKVEVEIPTSSELVDAHYIDEINVLSSPPIVVEEKPSEQDVRTDYYALFRSSVVLVWAFMNVALIAVVLNVGGVERLMPSTPGGTSSSSTGSTPATKVRRAVFLEARDNCQSIHTATTRTTEIYLAVILWSVAGMALYRFIFCVVYLIKRLFTR